MPYNNLTLPESYTNMTLPFNDLTQVFATEIQRVGHNNPWAWLHRRLMHNDLLGIHLGDYIKFPLKIGDGPELEYTARIHAIYRDVNNKTVIDFWCDELLPDKIKWNDQLRDNDNKARYYNNALQSYIPYYSSTIYSYLNALQGNVCNSVSYSNSNTYIYFTSEDFTQTGVYKYIPANLKNYIVTKVGYNPKKDKVSTSGGTTSGSYIDITTANLGYLWIPTSVELYASLDINYSINKLNYQTIEDYYRGRLNNDGYSYSNYDTIVPTNLLDRYNNRECLIKYYPEYAALKDRNNPNANVSFWLGDVSRIYYINRADVNMSTKKIDIKYIEVYCTDENYLPLCFTIG